MGDDTRQFVLRAGVVLGVAAAFLLGYVLRGALLLFLSSVVVALALHPLAEWLIRRGWSRPRASLFLHVTIFACMASAVLFLMPVIVGQARALIARLPDLLVGLQSRLADSDNALIRHLSTLVPLSSSEVPVASPASARLLAGAWELVQSVAGSGLRALLLLALSHAWLCEGDAAVRGATLLLPFDRRVPMRELYEVAKLKIGAYLRGQLVVCLSAAITSGLIYLAMGLPNALVLGLVSGVGESVPIFGPLISIALVVVSALLFAPSLVWWVLLAALANHLFQSYLLLPRVMGRAIGVSPLVVLVSVSAVVSLVGIQGAILAIPAAAVLQLTFDRWRWASRQPKAASADGRDRASVLRLRARELVNDARRVIHEEPDAEVITDELERMLNEVRELT